MLANVMALDVAVGVGVALLILGAFVGRCIVSILSIPSPASAEDERCCDLSKMSKPSG